MASVRLTRALRDEIYRNATNAFVVANPEPKASTAFEQKLRAALPRMPSQEALSKAKALLDQCSINESKSLDNKHFNITERTISKIHIAAHNSFKRPNLLTVDFSAPVQILGRNYDSYYGPDDILHIDDLSQHDQSEITEYVMDLRKRKEELNTKSSEYAYKIRDLLDKCDTLKQLLEVWPAVESLVPQEKINRMHEKVTRKQRAAQVREEISFDADEVNQVVLTAKLMGA